MLNLTKFWNTLPNTGWYSLLDMIINYIPLIENYPMNSGLLLLGNWGQMRMSRWVDESMSRWTSNQFLLNPFERDRKVQEWRIQEQKSPFRDHKIVLSKKNIQFWKMVNVTTWLNRAKDESLWSFRADTIVMFEKKPCKTMITISSESIESHQ